MSLSVRRAWIEIIPSNGTFRSTHVALRKESVDRNRTLVLGGLGGVASLSVRRAWIEMTHNG